MTKLAPPKFVYVFMMLLIDFTLNFAPSNKVNAVFVNFDCCANFATQSVFGLQNKLNIGVNRNFYGGHLPPMTPLAKPLIKTSQKLRTQVPNT